MHFRGVLNFSYFVGSFLLSLSAQAGGYNYLLFDESGKRLSPSEFSGSFEEASWIQPRISARCDDGSGLYCINWKLRVPDSISGNPDPSDLLEIETVVNEALRVWSSPGDVGLRFVETGLLEENAVPYLRDLEGEIVLDDFGNEIIEGDFVISFEVPDEIDMPENSLAVLKTYVIPDVEGGVGEIKWAGIYINPQYNPYLGCDSGQEDCLQKASSRAFSIWSVLVFEMGQALGLSTSAHPDSLMYVTQTPGSPKTFSQLHTDDLYWIRSLYRAPGSGVYGSITGKMIRGEDGGAELGSHIFAIEESKIDDFLEVFTTDFIEASTFSRNDGRFLVPKLPDGKYVLLALTSYETTVRPELFGEWFELFGPPAEIEPDFYDGKDRESNLEASNYSPRLILLAAKVIVDGSQTTQNVQIITNQTDTELEEILAAGASREELSSFTLEDLDDLLSEEFNTEAQVAMDQRSGGGGCSVQKNRYFILDGEFLVMALILFVFLLGLLVKRTLLIGDEAEILPDASSFSSNGITHQDDVFLHASETTNF